MSREHRPPAISDASSEHKLIPTQSRFEIPEPPEIESKVRYEGEDNSDDDAAPPEDSGDVIPQLGGHEKSLQLAVRDAASEIARLWLTGETSALAPDQLQQHLKVQIQKNHELESLRDIIWRHYELKRQEINQPIRGNKARHKRKLKAKVKEGSDIIDYIVEYTADYIQQPENRARFAKESQRTSINRILRITKRFGTLYEILDVSPTASNGDIQKAWKQIAAKVHPDRNSDSDAATCMQVVNNARDVLCNSHKRTTYDEFCKTNPRKAFLGNEFDESFAPNAFDDDDDEDDDENEDIINNSEEEDEDSQPKPSLKIKSIHNQMESDIREFFSKLQGRTPDQVLRRIDKRNEMIKNINERHHRNPQLHQVPRTKLYFLQFVQRRILVHSEVGLMDSVAAENEIKSLVSTYERTATRGLHQWPTAWAQAIKDPLQKSLQVKFNMEIQDSDVEMDDDEVEISDDEEMRDDGPEDDGSERQDLASEVGGAGSIHNAMARRIVPLRPGYTILGDKILGYVPSMRRNRYTGELDYCGGRFILEIEGPSGIRLGTDSEIGSDAAWAYHNLPDSERNDISDSVSKYGRLPVSAFGGITGHTAASRAGTATRVPDTYLRINLSSKTDLGSRFGASQVHILTRTALRRWLRKPLADKYIDDFLVNNDIVPPWIRPDPAIDSGYLSLQYPLPSRNNPSHAASATRANPDDNPTRQQPAVASSELESLTTKIDKLLEFLVEDRKQQEEDRRFQRKLIGRLLPTPGGT